MECTIEQVASLQPFEMLALMKTITKEWLYENAECLHFGILRIMERVDSSYESVTEVLEFVLRQPDYNATKMELAHNEIIKVLQHH